MPAFQRLRAAAMSARKIQDEITADGACDIPGERQAQAYAGFAVAVRLGEARERLEEALVFRSYRERDPNLERQLKRLIR